MMQQRSKCEAKTRKASGGNIGDCLHDLGAGARKLLGRTQRLLTIYKKKYYMEFLPML